MCQLLLAIILKDHILVLLNDCETLVEDLPTIFLTHEGLKFGKLAGRNIDHLFFADVACNIPVLSNIVNCRSLCTLGLTCSNIGIYVRGLSQALQIILIAIVAHFRNVSRPCCWRLWVHTFGVTFVTRSQMSLILLIFVIEEGWVIVLLHELLRWRVHIQVCHLLLDLLGLFLSSHNFLFLFILLLSLDALKLIEHILVVQEGV